MNPVRPRRSARAQAACALALVVLSVLAASEARAGNPFPFPGAGGSSARADDPASQAAREACRRRMSTRRRFNPTLEDLRTLESLRKFVTDEAVSEDEAREALRLADQPVSALGLATVLERPESIGIPQALGLALRAYFPVGAARDAARRVALHESEADSPAGLAGLPDLIGADALLEVVRERFPTLNWLGMDRYPRDQWHQLIADGIYRNYLGVHGIHALVLAIIDSPSVGAARGLEVWRVFAAKYPELAELPAFPAGGGTGTAAAQAARAKPAEDLAAAAALLVYAATHAERNQLDVSALSLAAIENGRAALARLELATELTESRDTLSGATERSLRLRETGARASATQAAATERVVARLREAIQRERGELRLPQSEVPQVVVDAAVARIRAELEYDCAPETLEENYGGGSYWWFRCREVGARAERTTEAQAQAIVQRVLEEIRRRQRSARISQSDYTPEAVARAIAVLRDAHQYEVRSEAGSEWSFSYWTLTWEEIGARRQATIERQSGELVQRVLEEIRKRQGFLRVAANDYRPESVARAVERLRAEHEYAVTEETGQDYGYSYLLLRWTEIGARAEGTLRQQAAQILATARQALARRERSVNLGFASYVPGAVESAIAELARDPGVRATRRSAPDGIQSTATILDFELPASPAAPSAAPAWGRSGVASAPSARAPVTSPAPTTGSSPRAAGGNRISGPLSLDDPFEDAVAALSERTISRFCAEYLESYEIARVLFRDPGLRGGNPRLSVELLNRILDRRELFARYPTQLRLVEQLLHNVQNMRLGASFIDEVYRDLPRFP